MKAILEFELPEEQADFDRAVGVGFYYSTLNEIGLYLRQLHKYDGHQSFRDTAEMAEKIRQRFHEITADCDLD